MVALVNTASGELRHTLTHHTNAVNCLAFSPDGKLLATGSADNTVALMLTPDDPHDTHVGIVARAEVAAPKEPQPVAFEVEDTAHAADAAEATVVLADTARSEKTVESLEAELLETKRAMAARVESFESEAATLRAQLAELTAAERFDVETGEVEAVQLDHGEAVEELRRSRKWAVSPSLGEFVAETEERVVRIKKEKVELGEELEDKEDLNKDLVLHGDKLMSYIDALKAQVTALGGVPVPLV